MTVNHTLEEYAIALRDAKGLVTHAAARLGVTREAVRRRLLQHPTLQQARDDAREALLDLAEASLITQIEQGEGWAVCFFLKTQGRDRGYVERIEERSSLTGEIRIRIEAVDDRRDPALD